jgi:hypothetical protein
MDVTLPAEIADMLKEAVDLARPKTDLALAVVEQSRVRYPMNGIARALGVSRSNLIERASIQASWAIS